MAKAELVWLPTRSAARRVHRSVRTIRHWRAAGMPVRFVDGRMEVEEETLLLWWRTKTLAHPVTKWRVRAAQRAAAGS